ncbi:hypothetical protein LRR18_03215 [Mangrovimonas sp. AS39]|uniref:hypothetical protein n=1 Tax=Mangrovimonas TaxID=1211036 RepID=UPI0006B63DD6|nr:MULTISPECIES: hypothetical protein [Mangrovimonas]MCF1190581.1 hypothetical protein [Mangrovimonas futianensis]MCF1193667.1 hypothetical protein [Mangrovimonas futianensis]MCF1420631.1 hypothetical protein [Mangrovimonas futianensis]NIK91131.1 hypothetical protein [Mangrovimonas sp. CR14]
MNKNVNTNRSFSITRMYCDLFGHHYEVSKKVTQHVNEYTCKCCKKQLTTNSNGNLTILTPKYREINNLLEEMYSKRLLRLKEKTFSTQIC